MRPSRMKSVLALVFSTLVMPACDPGTIGDPGDGLSETSTPLWVPEGYMLEDDQLVPISENPTAFPATVSTWTKGLVFFTFSDPALTASQKDAIRSTLQAYTGAARIRFLERADQPYYVGIRLDPTTDGSSYASVGMMGADQVVAFYPDYASDARTILHEFGHTIGRKHEHQRPDRDDYVTVLWDNIETSQAHNFDIHPGIPTVVPYDFDSIMHYHKQAFGKKACAFCSTAQTIDPKPAYDAYENTMGTTSSLSDLDRQVIVSRYGEPVLDHGLSHTGLQASTGAYLTFAVEIPAGTVSAKITTEGGSGDLDLYLRAGQKPTKSSYTEASEGSTNQETVQVQSPAAGLWYAAMYAFSSFSGASIRLEIVREGCGQDPVCAQALTPGVAAGPFTLVRGERRVLSFDVPEGTGDLLVRSTGGTGDVDLYLKRDGVASPLDFDGKAFTNGNEETLTVRNPASGTYTLTLYGYQAGTLESIQLNLSSQADTYTSTTSPTIRDHSGSAPGVTEQTVQVDRAGDSGLVRVKTVYDHARQSDLTMVLRAPDGTAWTLRDRTDEQRAMPDIFDIDASGVDSLGTWTLTYTDQVRGPLMVACTARELALTFTGGDPGAVCGNGQIDTGEDCDGGACCTDCRFTASGTVCRPANGECDQAESCSGQDAFCPLDQVSPDGSACSAGTCLEGVCTEQSTGTVVALDERGLAATKGQELRFTLVVPANGSDVLIQMTGGTGDADLYVKKGSEPTGSSYDCRPYENGNEESCTGSGPGTYHILIRAFAAFSGLDLTGSYYLGGDQPGGTIVAIDQTDLGGAQGSELRFSMEVPAGASLVEVLMSGGSGDADLYVRKGAAPTTSSYDCRPYRNGNDESCTASGPGTYHVLIQAFEAYSGASLIGRYTMP